MQELGRRDDKLNLANPADPELDVTFALLEAHDVALDSFLDRRDFVEQVRGWTFRKNERLQLAQEIVGQFAIAADPACLDEGQALPHFAKTGVVIFHALELADERTGATLRAQAQIHAEE